MDGSATFTTVASRTIIRKPVHSTTRAIQRFFSAICWAVMSSTTGLRSPTNRSRNGHQDGRRVGRVVNGAERQLLQPDDRALPERPAAACASLQLQTATDDDHQLVRPLGLFVKHLATGFEPHQTPFETVTAHRSKTSRAFRTHRCLGWSP